MYAHLSSNCTISKAGGSKASLYWSASNVFAIYLLQWWVSVLPYIFYSDESGVSGVKMFGYKSHPILLFLLYLWKSWGSLAITSQSATSLSLEPNVIYIYISGQKWYTHYLCSTTWPALQLIQITEWESSLQDAMVLMKHPNNRLSFKQCSESQIWVHKMRMPTVSNLAGDESADVNAPSSSQPQSKPHSSKIQTMPKGGKPLWVANGKIYNHRKEGARHLCLTMKLPRKFLEQLKMKFMAWEPEEIKDCKHQVLPFPFCSISTISSQATLFLPEMPSWVRALERFCATCQSSVFLCLVAELQL